MNEKSLKTIELEMAVLIRRVNSITSNRNPENLVRSAYLLLHQLSLKGSAGVKTLAEELQLDISTVSRQAASLEQKGYVAKVPSPLDKRSYFYEITDVGATELRKYKQARFEKISKLLHDWDEEEHENFGKLLKKFNDALKGEI
ncbi:MarR family transcriptional regulator [Jeotgalibacillus sp. S-D1]|uniref:MarR family winged helix-turn-helix transcriptional regulator n=1 Tax=Jeotgalibacillus sp. S-D1 TaxID=2552189 RepID=UPI0010593EE0|nr:MarR family transcriptional regulator [Jeotgalibacillus sp. S-D1]TDL30346.1 MarR family transcriptional regulator [Jeotgalibacillus sp. S-D1]